LLAPWDRKVFKVIPALKERRGLSVQLVRKVSPGRKVLMLI